MQLHLLYHVTINVKKTCQSKTWDKGDKSYIVNSEDIWKNALASLTDLRQYSMIHMSWYITTLMSFSRLAVTYLFVITNKTTHLKAILVSRYQNGSILVVIGFLILFILLLQPTKWWENYFWHFYNLPIVPKITSMVGDIDNVLFSGLYLDSFIHSSGYITKRDILLALHIGKIKVMSICIEPIHETSLMRSGIARIVKGYHSFTGTPCISSVSRMSRTCLCLPSHSWYSCTDPGGMEGWVDLGAK